MVVKYTKILISPPYCVIGVDTIIRSAIDCKPYSLITNESKIVVRMEGVYRDKDDDTISYT